MSLITPGEKPHIVPHEVWEHTQDRGVDITMDLLCSPDWEPELMLEDGEATIEVSIPGMRYVQSLIYYSRQNQVVASRTIFEIPKGGRSPAFYLSKQAPPQPVDIHRGAGSLILGDPNQEVAHNIPLFEGLLPQRLIEPGTMYFFDAPTEPLTVSELWFNPDLHVRYFRAYCVPGAQQVRSQDGSVPVPRDFFEPHY